MDDCKVFVGLDYHQASVQVCVENESGEVLLNRRCNNDWRLRPRSLRFGSAEHPGATRPGRQSGPG